MAGSQKDFGEIIVYRTAEGETKIDVRVANESVWLTLDQIAELFSRDKSVISRHIRNIFVEGELVRDRTVAKNATVRIEGSREVHREVDLYNLDAIISVGYRVKSQRGTQFGLWATEQLKEFIIKGYLLNDTRFKQQADSDYFEELLARIRDIRSSENVFYKKVLDLFATSADYQKNAPETHRIFAIVQNKLHWAAHGHTAAEIVHDRVDAAKSNMGLTSWSGQTVRKLDIEVSKNYLSAEEFDTLNRLVDANLDIAELQARARKVSYMRDWETKLGEVLTIAGHDILKDQGIMSRDQANLKATIEYEIFNRGRVNQDSQIEQDFEEASKLASKLRE